MGEPKELGYRSLVRGLYNRNRKNQPALQRGRLYLPFEKERISPRNYPKKAFTLIEVLVVVILLGVFFSTLAFTFKSIFESSLNISTGSRKLREISSLYWSLSRAIYGAKKLKLVDGRELYLITTGGMFYPGVVKAAYIYKNGTLYYYEFPYPYGNLTAIDLRELKPLYHFSEFAIFGLEKNVEKRDASNRVKTFKIEADGISFYVSRF